MDNSKLALKLLKAIDRGMFNGELESSSYKQLYFILFHTLDKIKLSESIKYKG